MGLGLWGGGVCGGLGSTAYMLRARVQGACKAMGFPDSRESIKPTLKPKAPKS